MNRLERYVAQYNPEMDGEVVAAMRKRRRIKRVEVETREREFFNAPWRGFLRRKPELSSRGSYTQYAQFVGVARAESKIYLFEMSGYSRWEARRAFIKALRKQPPILEGAFREALLKRVMREMMKREKCDVILEAHAFDGSDQRKLEAWYRRNGFRVARLSTRGLRMMRWSHKRHADAL